MSKKSIFPNLYCITDKKLSPNKNVLKDIEQMCRAGCKIVQLREKNIDLNQYLNLAKKAKKITNKYGAKLIINDNCMVAKKSKADGVHLGQDDVSIKEARNILGPDAIIGVSTHSVKEFREAKKQSPNYIAVGAIFLTTTKKSAKVIGLDILNKICSEKENMPIVAIGGINRSNFKQVLEQGVDCIAMIGEILRDGNINKNIDFFKNYLIS